MLIFSVSEFTQNTTKVFNSALNDEVIINNNDGNSYKLLPIKQPGKSPLENIPRITDPAINRNTHKQVHMVDKEVKIMK